MSGEQQTLDRGRKIAEELGIAKNCQMQHMIPVYYEAEGVDRLLGESVEVFAQNKNSFSSSSHDYAWNEIKPLDPKRTALLIAIRPLMQESEERKLLRELLIAQEFSHLNSTYIPEKWAERVRELLARTDSHAESRKEKS